MRASSQRIELPRFGWLPSIRNIQIQTHSRCNANCLFCPFIESSHAAEPGRMTDETWHLILSNLRPFTGTIQKVCPYLMQEPLIDPSIFSKIEDIYRCFPTAVVEVSTNGAALTDKVIEKLLKAFGSSNGNRPRRHDIWVSHHGISKEIHEHIMQIDYSKATNNLISLLKASNGRYSIKIRGAGQSHDGKHQYFTKEQYHEYWEKILTENNINRRNISIDFFKFHDRAATLHRTERGANLLNMGTIRKIDKEHPFWCSRVTEWLHFMWDGQIRLCCMDYHAEVQLPNIHNMSLLEYFHDKSYSKLCRQVSGIEESDPNFICKRCTSPGG